MKGSQFVREARKRAGLTQTELAERAGTTQSAIARLERGENAPSLERLTELVRACGFDMWIRLVPADEAIRLNAQRASRSSPDDNIRTMIRAGGFANATRNARVKPLAAAAHE